MFKKILNNFKPFLLSVTAVGGTFVGYYSFLAYNNRAEFIDQRENDEQYKDMTRETNEYFGLSWGYKADYLVKEQIDSGDVFFIKYECDECLSLSQMVWCNFMQTFKQDQEYDSIGFAFRDSSGLKIISNQFGVTKIMEYAEFLSQPFLSELSMRKLIFKQQSQGNLPKSSDSRRFQKLLKSYFNSLAQLGDHKESEIDFAKNYLLNTDILSDKIKNSDIRPLIADYDQNNPFFLAQRLQLDNKLVIRSGTNKQLNRSNLFTSTSSFNK